MRKWIANDEQILEGLSQSDRGMETIDFADDNTIKTLGLQWIPSADNFTYKTTALSGFDGILSNTAKLYDPIKAIILSSACSVYNPN